MSEVQNMLRECAPAEWLEPVAPRATEDVESVRASVGRWFDGSRIRAFVAKIIAKFGEGAKNLTVEEITAFLLMIGCPFAGIVAQIVYMIIQATFATPPSPAPVP